MRWNSLLTGLALTFTFGIAGVASAQGAGSPDRPRDGQEGRRGPGGRGGMEMLLNGITLSADQQAQVKALGDRQRAQMEAERSQGGSTFDPRAARERGDTAGMGAWRAQMEQRREQQISALRTILTPDQRVQFDKNVTDMKARMAERGPRPNR